MTAADRIRARVAELQGIRERYLAYQQDRVAERDHHGAWDVAINLSETECEISGLEFALSAMAANETVEVTTSASVTVTGLGPGPGRCECTECSEYRRKKAET